MLRKIYHGFPLGHKINGIPRIHFFAKCGQTDCMVLELLGANLEDLFELVGSRFSMKTVLMIAFQLLDRIETVHKRGLVYRDIKPENFLLGRTDTKEFNIIHLVDFGLATFYRDPSSGRHLPYRDLKTMTGTARYMSIHSHLGKSQSRRDDLESIGYVLLYFAKGRLPWQGIKTQNLKEKYKKIRDAKMKFPVHVLCDDLPTAFTIYMTYVKKLGFSEEPDYEYLKDLFHELYETMGFSYSDPEFDWTQLELPSDLQKFNRANRGGGNDVVSSVDTEDSHHIIMDDFMDQDATDIGTVRDSSKAVTAAAEGDECLDTLGDLKNIKPQTKAMEGLTNSRWLLKSVNVSNSQGLLANESSAEQEFTYNSQSQELGGSRSTSQQQFPVVLSQPELFSSSAPTTAGFKPGACDSQNMSQGYFSNSGDESERGLEAIKMNSHNNPASINASQCENIEIVREDINEEYLSEEDVSFLCFSWKRRKSGRVTSNRSTDQIAESRS